MPLLKVNDNTTLRPIDEEDADALFALVDDNREYLKRWLPWLDANTTVSDTLNFIRASVDRKANNGGFVLLIEHEKQLCAVIGFNWIDWANRAGEIGYWLRQDRQGQGLMTACCRALIRYFFETLQLNRINIPVAVENHKSRAIPERLGFQQDGILRDAEWLYDHFVDHVVYTLLRRDYLAMDDASALKHQ